MTTIIVINFNKITCKNVNDGARKEHFYKNTVIVFYTHHLFIMGVFYKPNKSCELNIKLEKKTFWTQTSK